MTPSNGEDGMVEVSSARSGVKDTGFVGLEDQLVSLNRDGKGLAGEGALHLRDVVSGDESEVGDGDGGGRGLVVFAGSGFTSTRGVGVDGLELGFGSLVVLESLVLPAAIATVVGSGAGDELLLREGEEFASFDVVGTLNCTGGRESPA